MRKHLAKIAVFALLVLIVLGHIGLWRDPDIPLEVKRRLTGLNALAWVVILLPAWGVSRWLGARERAAREK